MDWKFVATFMFTFLFHFVLLFFIFFFTGGRSFDDKEHRHCQRAVSSTGQTALLQYVPSVFLSYSAPLCVFNPGLIFNCLFPPTKCWPRTPSKPPWLTTASSNRRTCRTSRGQSWPAIKNCSCVRSLVLLS